MKPRSETAAAKTPVIPRTNGHDESAIDAGRVLSHSGHAGRRFSVRLAGDRTGTPGKDEDKHQRQCSAANQRMAEERAAADLVGGTAGRDPQRVTIRTLERSWGEREGSSNTLIADFCGPHAR